MVGAAQHDAAVRRRAARGRRHRALQVGGPPTRAPGLDASIVAAIDAGRDIIVPDSHRAAALRLAWARHQLAAGRRVWTTPLILTWEAWLVRQWRAAVLRGDCADTQLLELSQERTLWESVLHDLEAAAGTEGELLTAHAGALMRAAARATQSLLQLSEHAASEEEVLLVRALSAVRSACSRRGLFAPALAPPEALRFLAGVPPPAIVGQHELTALQRALQGQCWNDVPLQLDAQIDAPARPMFIRAANLEAEIAACAQWCQAHLRRDAGARLLVLSACGDPALPTQAALLWRELAPDQRDDDELRSQLLAVEGGEPLLHQALVADALEILQLAGQSIETSRLLAVLRSPYFNAAAPLAHGPMCHWLFERGLARWETRDLRAALSVSGTREPAAGDPMAAWLDSWLALAATETTPGVRPAAEWAAAFSRVLDAAGFAPPARLDSRDLQRLSRWRALLDEFAALDAVMPPQTAQAALGLLRGLAAQARHQGASADAAITLSSALADPVAGYDGIWVLGLAEGRWPAPPRPDAYVPQAAQLQARWPEAGVAPRRAQALWALERWRQRTCDLVLSCPQREGELEHLPARILDAPGEVWLPAAPVAARHSGESAVATDQAFTPVAAGELVRPLRGGAERLRVQQDCPFRAQAQWRLAARPRQMLSDGITPPLRGRLLHAMLQGVWTELAGQSRLLALDAGQQAALLLRHWGEAAAALATAGAAWLPAPVIERERDRALRLAARVLDLERQRTPFTVQQCERSLEWQAGEARLGLRVDRIDRLDAGERVLVDYKSGAAGTVKLHEGELEPLQLALYACALAAAGEPVSAAALCSLQPAEPGFAGVAAAEGLLDGRMKLAPEWNAVQDTWGAQLAGLMAAHLAGDATLARSAAPCRNCHLPALCRRVDAAGPEQGDD